MEEGSLASDFRLDRARRALSAGQLPEARSDLDWIAAHHPDHRVTPTVLEMQKALSAAEGARRRRQEEERLASELSNVTRAQLIADPRRYRGKVFIRSLCCWQVRRSTYVTRTPFAELNIRTATLYNTMCNWSDAASERVEIRLDQTAARRIAANPDRYPTGCGVLGNDFRLGDARLRLVGVDEDTSAPIFWLAELP